MQESHLEKQLDSKSLRNEKLLDNLFNVPGLHIRNGTSLIYMKKREIFFSKYVHIIKNQFRFSTARVVLLCVFFLIHYSY